MRIHSVQGMGRRITTIDAEPDNASSEMEVLFEKFVEYLKEKGETDKLVELKHGHGHHHWKHWHGFHGHFGHHGFGNHGHWRPHGPPGHHHHHGHHGFGPFGKFAHHGPHGHIGKHDHHGMEFSHRDMHKFAKHFYGKDGHDNEKKCKGKDFYKFLAFYKAFEDQNGEGVSNDDAEKSHDEEATPAEDECQQCKCGGNKKCGKWERRGVRRFGLGRHQQKGQNKYSKKTVNKNSEAKNTDEDHSELNQDHEMTISGNKDENTARPERPNTA
ncbi:uncharacterized protein LOC105385440 [Plutella xylostella]|uniref:uncharacterized protein LOC105385440 n=1 Tax=Plutella xylostella TaxID=51655 RepID=UPI00203311FD|nr:uncharacterized protein LOC105385440 [Plutella xylostella]